jgi:hypothetical protein
MSAFLDETGLKRVWGKAKGYFLPLTGGTITGDLTIADKSDTERSNIYIHGSTLDSTLETFASRDEIKADVVAGEGMFALINANAIQTGSLKADIIQTGTLMVGGVALNFDDKISLIDGNSLKKDSVTKDSLSSTIKEDLSKISDLSDAQSGFVNSVDLLNTSFEELNGEVTNIGSKTAYIEIGVDEEDTPIMLLGKKDSAFKVQITNKEIDFLQNTNKLAYINGNAMYIHNATVTNNLSMKDSSAEKGFIWKKRDSGNLGLRWTDD